MEKTGEKMGNEAKVTFLAGIMDEGIDVAKITIEGDVSVVSAVQMLLEGESRGKDIFVKKQKPLPRNPLKDLKGFKETEMF
jgi:hypothetical protein